MKTKLKNENISEKEIQRIFEGIVQEPPWTIGDVSYFGPSTRSICMAGPIDYKTSYPITSQLLELNARSDKPIKLHINTEGGTLSDAFAIYDTIKNLRAPVIGITQGLCASGGLIVLLACTQRISTKHTLFFYHQPILNIDGFNSLESARETSNAYEIFSKVYDNTIMNETKISQADWNIHFKGKTTKYFTSKQALKFGFIHTIAGKQ